MVAAFTAYEQKLLVELASRHAFDRIIEVSVAVDFEAFENAGVLRPAPARAQLGPLPPDRHGEQRHRAHHGVLTSIGIAVVLFVLSRCCCVFVAVAAVFRCVATMLNSREAYEFEHGLTAEGRERQYLMELLTEREPAKEIRILERARSCTDVTQPCSRTSVAGGCARFSTAG